MIDVSDRYVFGIYGKLITAAINVSKLDSKIIHQLRLSILRINFIFFLVICPVSSIVGPQNMTDVILDVMLKRQSRHEYLVAGLQINILLQIFS